MASPRSSEPHLRAENDGQRFTQEGWSEDASDILVTGQMTLYEIESQSAVWARAIAERLGLPPNAPLEERLGALRKLYDFTMRDVRDALSELMDQSGPPRY